MRSSPQGRVHCGLVLAAAAALFGCRPAPPPEQHFYDVHIQPILNASCVGNTSPCHSIAVDPVTNTPTALGNLDLSSFEGVQKRRDVLRTYGSYPQPLLLLKAMPPESNQIPYRGKFYPSEIQHSGGSPIQPNSEAYFELKNWLDNGANRDGIAPQAVANKGVGPCSEALPPVSQRLTFDVNSQAYQDFKANVEPMLESSCAFGSCHGSPQADMYLTCGQSGQIDPEAETAFNYAQVAGFVIAPPGDPTMTNVDQSEILLRPLAVAAGGVSHTGGTFFQSRSDDTWVAWESWAKEVQMEPPLAYGPKTAGQTFFEDNVMPKLLVRGCDLEGCHSPDGFNDFRLRSGAFGFFAPAALTRNYHALADEFMAFDTADVKQSRAVKKNIIAASGGTTHRAGAVLEDLNTSVDTPCPQPFDPATATRAFCVLAAWQQIERQDRIAAGAVSPMTAGSTLPLVFVARPKNGDDLLHFDTLRGRGRSEAGRRHARRHRQGDRRRQRPQRARPLRRPGRPGRRRARSRVELRRHQGGLRGAAGGVERARSLVARRGRRHLPAAHQRQRPDRRRDQRPGAQLRSGVRPRQHHRLRFDALGNAHAAEHASEFGSLPGQAVDGRHVQLRLR